MANKPYSRLNYKPNTYTPSEYRGNTFAETEYQHISYNTAFNDVEDDFGADMKDALIGKINRKDAKVAVIGLGYVGLPLAVSFAEAGFSTTGIDVDAEVVDALRQQRSHVRDVTTESLQSATQKGLQFSSAYAKAAECDCISIAVPTPLTKTKEPDISFITTAVDALLPHLHRGMLLILESTTYPGTTEELLGARIQSECNLIVGRDIFVAFSPERVDPGNAIWKIKNTPKVVGGITPRCTELAKALYSLTIDKIHCVGSAKEAETVKLLENTFRAVNIGLVNEFLLMCNRMDIDVWNVIEAASTKPFGFMSFYPGPGIGGHCIPLDPMYMSWKAKSVDFYNRFIELATDINGNMPRFVISKLADMLNSVQKPLNGSQIAVLGLAYKKNVSDVRESPGVELVSLLQQKGSDVFVNDPLVTARQLSINAERIATEDLAQTDAVVLATDHDAYDYKTIAKNAPLILDCRNAFAKRGIEDEKIYKL